MFYPLTDIAEHVALRGHQSMRALERAGFSRPDVFRTVEMGLIVEVPRLGGYTASPDVTRRLLGDTMAEVF